MPFPSKRALDALARAGFQATHASSLLEIWSNEESEIYVHKNGDCYLYPVSGTEIDNRKFRVRTLAYILGRYAR